MSCAAETRVPTPGSAGHLDYYLRHGLNPVRYEMTDLRRHLDRRASLYRLLGLPPRLFSNARVLEVAPGSGQNSLYVAALRPRELVLVEPNPTAQEDINRLYAVQDVAPLRPRLVPSTFQDFEDDQPFDVVICENWLGHSPAERQLLRKLGQLVATDGMLIITTISPVGILPNVLRKALTCRLDRPNAPFAERTALLTSAFGSHLDTIPSMTRTHTDWVQDNVMNPAYFGILLTIPMVLEELGTQFDVFGSVPRFATDWRWFKSLWGEHRDFNGHFLKEYHAGLHNFLDYRAGPTLRVPARNQDLERAAWELIQAVTALELATYHYPADSPSRMLAAECALAQVEMNVGDLSPAVRSALAEFRDLFQRDQVTAEEVAQLDSFRGLFGRETLYLSLEKVR
jgi:SAM-dependent methyltransferase